MSSLETHQLREDLMSINVALRTSNPSEPDGAAASYLSTLRLLDVGSAPLDRRHTPDAVLSHPRFANARNAYVNCILALYEHDKFMNRLLMEAGRSLVFFALLNLHAAHDESERATWPTLSLVQKIIQPYGVSSARRVGDIVARFVETGFLKSEAAATDRRVKILTPTAKMLAHDREWLAANFTALHAIFPGAGYDAPMRRDPLYQQAHRAISRTMIPLNQRILSANPAIMLFLEREAGMMILMKLMQIAQAEGARLSFADIGNRFGVSRTHVRAVLQDAAQRDLVTLTPQAMSLQPALISAFDRFVAAMMAHYDEIHGMASGVAHDRLDRAS